MLLLYYIIEGVHLSSGLRRLGVRVGMKYQNQTATIVAGLF